MSRRPPSFVCDWTKIIAIAERLVVAEREYIGAPPTLRRLHYLLVENEDATEAGYINVHGCYQGLSRETAEPRRSGLFPQLSDETRDIDRPFTFDHAADAVEWLSTSYRHERAALLPLQLILVTEKEGLLPLLGAKFDWLPRTSLVGFSSVSLQQEMAAWSRSDPRPTVGLYLGDADPSGRLIPDAAQWHLPFRLERVALTHDQVVAWHLPTKRAKDTDVRTARMVADLGHAYQVEVDAVPAVRLVELLCSAITNLTDLSFDTNGRPVMPDADLREAEMRGALADAARRLGPS